MAKAAHQQILTAGLNIYLLELVVLHLGESLVLRFNGPGHFSFDAGMGSQLISGLDQDGGFGASTPAVIAVKAFRQAD
ncbi:hypothetical protein KBY99_03815 [Cyanobium sp. Maggiore-St4-Cus]|jgi:putative oxidoreductase|uniref:hypothetical protein n=1 Tax=Cyanobium sp. Maggiore-St4-Cus TaxID=2823717 RepID=UPI0020CEFAB6|nr:hypothetical protein [Cyanobium sp. Maggiore-St4-Cus]MCP9788105.1 hypothetical protein [Cyanobium sp. Maggiore-St4-Cus]